MCVCVLHQLIVFTGNYSSYSVANIMIRKSSSGCSNNTDYLDSLLPSHLVCPLDGIQCSCEAGKCRFFSAQSTLVCPCLGFHRRMLLMILSSLFQQCPSKMGGKWSYAALLQGAAFKISNSMQNSSSFFFSKHFIQVQVVQPYNSTDMATPWKNSLREIRFPFLPNLKDYLVYFFNSISTPYGLFNVKI